MTTLEYIKESKGVYILQKQHPIMKQLRKDIPAPEIHGDKIWTSSYFIIDWLEKNPLPRRARVMEIGSGWGLLSIFCATHFDARVTAVDADENVFAYLKVHAALNEVKIKTLHKRFEGITRKSLAGHDLVAGGDICFWDELVEPLYTVIRKACQEKVGTIIVADPGRSPFLKLAKRCKKDFGAELLDWSVRSPRRGDGYLLIIQNPPRRRRAAAG